MKVVFCLFSAALLLLRADARRVKRDAWRTWEGLEANCDSSPKGNPCVTCACTTVTTLSGKNYNSCREDIKHCNNYVPCADSIVQQGECCPSCPNGENCSINGTIVEPGETKFWFKLGSDYKYRMCGVGGVVQTCTIETTILGSSSFRSHICTTPYGG